MSGLVIAGFDGSAEGRDALALTNLLAPALGSPVLVLWVATRAPFGLDWPSYSAGFEEKREQLETEASALLKDVGDVEVLAISAVSPARELHRLTRERNASLVVLGSTHRGPLNRVMTGTVADRLLGGASCEVAVAPRNFAETRGGLETIGCAFDGEEESLLALEAAAALADSSGAALRVISILDPFTSDLDPARSVVPGPRAVISDALAGLPWGLPVTAEMIEGDVAPSLERASESSDLLVLGSRSYGPRGRVLLGSVSSILTRTSHCPVLVVPRPRSEDEAATAELD